MISYKEWLVEELFDDTEKTPSIQELSNNNAFDIFDALMQANEPNPTLEVQDMKEKRHLIEAVCFYFLYILHSFIAFRN